jgi:hypothetical protein
LLYVLLLLQLLLVRIVNIHCVLAQQRCWAVSEHLKPQASEGEVRDDS